MISSFNISRIFKNISFFDNYRKYIVYDLFINIIITFRLIRTEKKLIKIFHEKKYLKKIYAIKNHDY